MNQGLNHFFTPKVAGEIDEQGLTRCDPNMK